MKFVFLFLVLILLFNQNSLNGKVYKGAEYRTKAAFTYGRFEARFKPANREGVVSSFFTYHEISSSANWNEIDIEFIGRYSNNIQFNTITGGQKNHVRSNYLDFDPYIDFHTYAFEWTPDYIAWFVDGEEVYRQTGDFIQTVFREQKIMMNIWNPVYTSWVGYWSDEFLPARSYYDWVSYSSYTPGSGSSGTNNNFTLQWKDDFDSWDQSRWEKATHTFSGNLADFVQENAVFQDGYLVLCLTDENNTGFTDNKPPAILWARENFDNTVIVKFSEEIDKTSAEKISNFSIPGVQITNAVLSEDKKNVLLSTQNYDQNITYNVIVNNIYDDESTPNKMSLKAKTVNQINELSFPIMINTGGAASGNFITDQEFGSSVEYGYLNGAAKMWPQNIIIGGTSNGNIYKNELNGMTTYKIRVRNGSYNIKLMFAENEFEEVGKRIFDVVAEGELLKDNLDIYAEVGKNYAYEINANIGVNDEKIDLYFPEEIGVSILNGIIIEQITTGMNEYIIIPKEFELMQNYPNPFNNSTIIKYSLNQPQNLKLKIFDLLGRNINSIDIGSKPSGEHSVEWDGTDLNKNFVSSGVYFYQLEGDQISQIKKLMLVK